MVGATAAQSIYYIPKSDLTAVATSSRGRRRIGARLWHLAEHGRDRDDDRRHRRAARRRCDRTALEERVPHRHEEHAGRDSRGRVARRGSAQKGAEPSAVDRARGAQRQYEAAHPGKRYGISFACTQRDFGTGAESAFAKVEFDADGRIALAHSGTEIGTGASTAQALAVAKWLGKPASQVRMSITDWADLLVVSSGDPYLMSQAEQDCLSANPRWSPALASPASATNSAYYLTTTPMRRAKRRASCSARACGLPPRRSGRRASAVDSRRPSSCASRMHAGATASSAPTAWGSRRRRTNSASSPARPCTRSIANGARRSSISARASNVCRSTGCRCDAARVTARATVLP